MTFDWDKIIDNLKGVTKESIQEHQNNLRKIKCLIRGKYYPCETIQFEEEWS